MRPVALFEKVSEKQFNKDMKESFILKDDTYDDIILPVRATPGSAGYDFFAPTNLYIPPRSVILIPTGIKCKIDMGYVLKLYPRSSIGFKHRVSLVNTVGIIDSDYYGNEKNEGHIMIKLYNPNDYAVSIAKGEAFAQGIFEEFYIAYHDRPVNDVRVGGIGSTNTSPLMR